MLVIAVGALILSLAKECPRAEIDPRPAVSVSAPVEALPADQAYRERRMETRQREKEALEAVAVSAYADPKDRAMAADMLRDMVQNEETELAVEAALSARGWPEALCAARQGEATVFLSRALTAQEANLILEIARAAAGNACEIIRVTGF